MALCFPVALGRVFSLTLLWVVGYEVCLRWACVFVFGDALTVVKRIRFEGA